MLNQLVESALKSRLWVFTIFLAVCALGLLATKNLPIDAVPDITNVQVVVNTKTGALDPGKIEKLVTYPIETEMAGIPGVEDIRSLSKYGLSQIVIIFEDRTNIYFARQLVAERLQNVRSNLPDGLSPQLAPVTTGLGEVLMYVVEPKAGSALAAKPERERLLYLKEVQEYVIKPQLKKLSGVAEVDTNGGLTKQIHIDVFPERLERNGLSLEKFISKIDSVGESFGGGYIQKEGTQIIIRATGQVVGLETIKNLPLALNVGGRAIRIRDVADVSAEGALRVGAATTEGEETVLGTVLMRIGANSREVSLSAEKVLLNEIKLPDGVAVSVVYSRSHLVNSTIHTILKNLAEGAALVVIVLLLLLGNLRAALIVTVAIPVSMLFALKGMETGGISANLMSLGAIDFGLLVDGAVVLIENIIRQFEELRGRKIDRKEKFQIVLSASREVMKPLVFGLFIIMLVYVPILYLEGVEGKMFRPMAATVLLALGASLFVALFLMPALAYLFIPDRIEHGKEPWLFRQIHRLYEPALKFSLSRRWLVGAVIVLPALLALLLFFRLGSDFVPQLDEGDLLINLTRETRQDIDTSVHWQKRAEKIISKFEEVERVFSRMGTPEIALDPMGPHLADTFVVLKRDKSQWPLVDGKPRTKEQLFEAMKEELEKDNPKQEISSTQPIEMRLNEILEGSRADVSLRIFGPDLDKLLDYSTKAQEILSSVKGTSSIESDPLTALTKSPVLDVVLNYEKMAGLGISLKDVNGILEASMSGREVGSYYEEDRRFPVILHLDESLRNNTAEISKLPVGLPEGGTIPLSSVTEIKQRDQVTTIARSAARRYSAVSIFLKDRDIGSFVAEAKQRIESELKLPPEYELSWGGQFKNLEKAKSRLMVIVPAILAVILLLLLKSFGTLRHTLLVFSAIPFAMVGGVFALYLRGINFSVSAAVGFIALTGVATLNSMVMVSFFNQLRSMGTTIKITVFKGALTRLRPVVMTAMVASFGFIPMAFNTGAGSEVQRPLATVVIGGLATSTILTLIVVPVLYSWIERKYGTLIDETVS
ncbi:MAG: efflux RND transporter permease subunit [Deltaproteobacteria bacterium]|nr:efflux RND transporter permease subunit [Deltaproteobacteria bacterium]